MLPIADVGMAFSLAEDRGLSRSRFNRHSPGFNQHSPGFVCSVLRIADAGMAFLYHINSLILCVCVFVCVTALFRCFHIEKSLSRPVSIAQCFSWGDGFFF